MTAPVGQVPGSLIDWAAGVIGISPSIVAAQINDESGGNPNAVSPTGAEGVAQFEPGTWQGEGCTGSPFNVNDAMKCYAKFMYQLVRQFHGNVRDALAAYNAGPGNLQAGYGYADAILAAAGQPSNVTAKGGTGKAGSGSSGGGGASNASKDPTCAWGFQGSLVVTSLNICVVKKTTIRHIVGGMLLLSGGGVLLVGAALLAAAGFQHTGAGRAVEQIAGMVPGVGPAASAASRAAPRPARTRETRQPAPAPAEGDRKIRTGRGQVSQDWADRFGTAP